MNNKSPKWETLGKPEGIILYSEQSPNNMTAWYTTLSNGIAPD